MNLNPGEEYEIKLKKTGDKSSYRSGAKYDIISSWKQSIYMTY